MAARFLIFLTFGLSSCVIFAGEVVKPAPNADALWSRLPLLFEANQGQFPEGEHFVVQRSGLRAAVTSQGLELKFPNAEPSVAIHFQSQMTQETPQGIELQPTLCHRFLGSDPSKWTRDIPLYARVRYPSILPGVALEIYGADRAIEFDFIVQPAADPGQIGLQICGGDHVDLGPQGEIMIKTSAGEISIQKPEVYQEIQGKRARVDGRFTRRDEHEFGFALGDYDPARPLIIDPVVAYSTFFGGTGHEAGSDIIMDRDGNAYVVGFTGSTDMTVKNPMIGSFQGGISDLYNHATWGDAFLCKIGPSGNTLLFSTYFGGTDGETAASVALDPQGNVVIAGSTSSDDFPVTPGTFQTNYRDNRDAFVTKFDPQGQLLFSTYLGGENFDECYHMVTDDQGFIYVTGVTASTYFPVTSNAVQTDKKGTADAFAAKMTPAGDALVWGTFVGGEDLDAGWGCAVDSLGNTVICGWTQSKSFPMVNPVQPARGGSDDGFVVKLNPDAGEFVFSTYLAGRAPDIVLHADMDSVGDVYVIGGTGSSDFPLGNSSGWSSWPREPQRYDAFVSKIAEKGNTLHYTIFLGGSNDELGFDIAVGPAGALYVTGGTTSSDMVMSNAVQTQFHGGGDYFSAVGDEGYGFAFDGTDAFFAKLREQPGTVETLYATYLGGGEDDGLSGVRVDGCGNAYFTGVTMSADFPLKNPLQNTYKGAVDAVILKLNTDDSFCDDSHRLIYPWISYNDQFASIVVVNNLGDTPADVTLTARRENGNTQTVQKQIPARGFLKYEAADLFPDLGKGPGYSVELITNSAQVRGRWVTNYLGGASGKSPSQGVAVRVPAPDEEPGTQVGKKLLFGFLPITDDLTSAPVITNVGLQPTNVTLSFYNQAGDLVYQDSATLQRLQPYRPFARVANTLVPDDSEDIFLIAESSSELITGVVFVFNNQHEPAIGNATAIQTTGQGTMSRSLLYSWISNNSQFESIVVANNFGNTDAQVTFTAQRADGSSQTVSQPIPAHGFLKHKASVLFRTLGSGAGYSAVMSTNSPYVQGRWVTNNLTTPSGRSPSQGDAVLLPLSTETPEEGIGSSILFGFLPITGGLTSAPVVININDGPVDVIMYFFDESGNLVLRDEDTLKNLPPMRPFAAVANTLVPQGTGDVYMVAQTYGGLITGVAFIFNAQAEPAIGNATGVPFSAPGFKTKP